MVDEIGDLGTHVGPGSINYRPQSSTTLHIYRFICSPNYGILRKCYNPRVSVNEKLYRSLSGICGRAPFFECQYQHCRGEKSTRVWGLIEVNSKCRALLITRIWLQGQREGTMMVGLQIYWRLQGF